MTGSYCISAVIPAYNNGKYIGRAIESVLAQSYKPLEVIVVDDGSTDNTKEIVASFGDEVRYIHKDNGGASSARNAGILAAKGDWVAFLDADDQWLPCRLKNQVLLLEKAPSLNWVSSNYINCLCLSERKAPYNPVRRIESILKGRLSLSYYDAVIRDVAGWTGTMLIKKNCLIEAGLFNDNYQLAEDLDMWWRIACRSEQIGIVAEPAAIYHTQIGGSITKKRFAAELYGDLLTRHRTIAAEFGKSEQFGKMANFMLTRWLRSMLFHKDRAEEVRFLLARCGNFLPIPKRQVFFTATATPALTATILRTISKISRKFNLRRRLVPPPDKMKKG